MSESVQPQTPTDKPERRAYGLKCSNCGRMLQVDFVDLPNDAQIEDLRAKLEQEQKLGDYQICTYLCDDGSVCNSTTQTTKENVEFVGLSDLEPEPRLEF